MPEATVSYAIAIIVVALIAGVIGPQVAQRSAAKDRKAEAMLAAEIRKKEKEEDASIRAAERAEDYARQDEVARRSAEAADLQLAQQKAVADQAAEAASLLLAENQKVAETAKTTNDKLDVIHTLVNSNMTESMQGDLDSTTLLLASLRDNVALREEAGLSTSPETTTAIAVAQAKIAELTSSLSDRRRQSDIVDAQVAKLAADGSPLAPPD